MILQILFPFELSSRFEHLQRTEYLFGEPVCTLSHVNLMLMGNNRIFVEKLIQCLYNCEEY